MNDIGGSFSCTFGGMTAARKYQQMISNDISFLHRNYTSIMYTMLVDVSLYVVGVVLWRSANISSATNYEYGILGVVSHLFLRTFLQQQNSSRLPHGASNDVSFSVYTVF